MANDAHTQQAFSLVYIFEVTRKYSLYILGIVGISALMAIILTMPFIYKPEFHASAIIYPTSAERFDVANVFAEDPDLYLYGAGKEVEKLENIANSETVKKYVIDSLDLWSVYGIDREQDESPKFYALRTFDGMVTAKRVAGHGLEIEAYDTDPQRAADIVNLMLTQTDRLNREMLNRNKSKIMAAYERGAHEVERRMDRLNDSLSIIRREHNVLRTLAQTERMVEQIMIAQSDLAAAEAGIGSLSASRKRLDMLTTDSIGAPLNLERFREGLDKSQNLENVLEEMAIHLAHTREKIEYLRAMAAVDYSTVTIADYAHASDKKARPVRWIILLATVIIAGIASIFGAVLIEGLTSSVEEKSEVRSS